MIKLGIWICIFIDCQDFKLLHAHWWFWEEGVVIICPQSSGENCFFFSLLLLSLDFPDLTSFPCLPVCWPRCRLQSLLQDRDGSTQLMLDADYRFQVTFPFRSSVQALELLQVPNSLNLTFLTRTWRAACETPPSWLNLSVVALTCVLFVDSLRDAVYYTHFKYCRHELHISTLPPNGNTFVWIHLKL